MKVLVVEDEIEIANDIIAGLEDAGFTTQLCNNGHDAWFLGSTEVYDAIVLDLGLPQLDGPSVLKGSIPARTTTCQNPFRWLNSWLGYGLCCGARTASRARSCRLVLCGSTLLKWRQPWVAVPLT